MRELISWEFNQEELQLIKYALIKFDKRSPYHAKAQNLASQIPVEPIHNNKDRQEGLAKDIFLALIKLGSATSSEIEERLGLTKPSSVSAVCSRLAKEGLLVKEVIPLSSEVRQGVAAKYRYSVKKQACGVVKNSRANH